MWKLISPQLQGDVPQVGCSKQWAEGDARQAHNLLIKSQHFAQVEVAESDKKIERKDQRIQQLERNLREALSL